MMEIKGRHNPVLKALARLGNEKKYRRETGEMLCEGEKMLREALASDAKISNVLVCQGRCGETLETLVRDAENRGVSVYTAPATLFMRASQVETPQNVVFSCAVPDWSTQNLGCMNHVLLLEELQDPGNLGTILRTADAFALDIVILCEGCADPFSPKVVRATMGAAFRMPCVCMPLEDAVGTLKREGFTVYAAAPHEQSAPVDHTNFDRSAVIIGNEGRGLSRTALELCDRRVVIPMNGRADSLNAGVAASIVIYEMTK